MSPGGVQPNPGGSSPLMPGVSWNPQGLEPPGMGGEEEGEAGLSRALQSSAAPAEPTLPNPADRHDGEPFIPSWNNSQGLLDPLLSQQESFAWTIPWISPQPLLQS